MLALRRHGFQASVTPDTGFTNVTVRAPTVVDLSPNAPEDWWPNWPTMNGACHQGSSTTHILDPTRYAELADKDVVILQSFYPTESRKVARKAGIDGVHALNPNTKFLLYFMLQETTKVLFTPAGNDPFEVSCALITDPVKGNPNWHVHRVNQTGQAGRVECNFDPTNKWQCNMAVLVAGLNSLGENYATAFWKDWFTLLTTGVTNFANLIDGIFVDNFNARPPSMFQGNGAVTITDQDYDQDGSIDPRADFTAGLSAGGRMWSQGHLEAKSRYEQKFGSGKVLCPNAARFDGDYIDGLGSPPVPISNHPYYRTFDLTLRESVQLNLGLAKSATAYSFNGGGGLPSFYRMYNIQERMLIEDNLNDRSGRSAVMLHATCVDRPPISTDYRYARFISALCMMVERAAMCVMQSPADPLSLDETLFYLGDPIGTRTMGALNESNPAASFPLRTPEPNGQTGPGVARFYWTKYTEGLVLIRGDSPSVGAYPSADAAAICTLPTPPAGKKYRRFPPNYVNPKTDRAIRNQSPTINNGADITTWSATPFDSLFVQLVDA